MPTLDTNAIASANNMIAAQQQQQQQQQREQQLQHQNSRQDFTSATGKMCLQLHLQLLN